jgi:hypothetical protein
MTGRLRWYILALLTLVTAINYLDRNAPATGIFNVGAGLGDVRGTPVVTESGTSP